MKKMVFILFIAFYACKSSIMIQEPISVNSNSCNNGTCTIEFIPNKTLTFKKDNIGILYPEITEGTKTILKYTYKKTSATNAQDSNYTEIILAELPNEIKDIALSNNNLQTIKLHFGRLCYCKGETGYFPVTEGNFKLVQTSKNSFEIKTNFTIHEVPQIISEINDTILLKSNESN